MSSEIAEAPPLTASDEATAAERKRFQDMLEALPVYVVLISHDYFIPFANRFFRERFGESKGRQCYEYLFGRTSPCPICESFKPFDTGQPHQWEWTGPDKHQYAIYDSLFNDVDGTQKILEIGVDITALKASEAHLAKLDRLLRSIREINREIVRETDEGKLFDHVCDTLAHVTGFRMVWVGLAQEQGKLVVPVARAGVGTDYLDAITITYDESPTGLGPTGTALRTGARVVCRDIEADPHMSPWRATQLAHGFRSSISLPIAHAGRSFAVLTAYLDQPDAFGDEELGLLGEVADDLGHALTSMDAERARRRADDELRLLNVTLEKRIEERTGALAQVNKELEAFAYSVSHDLRAPLRAIDGFSQALLEDYQDKLDAGGRDALQRVRAATQRMGQLIEDILQLSRAGRATLERVPVDLTAVARSIESDLRAAEPGRKLEFVVEDGLRAEADPRLVRQVLENLLANAWKFTGRQPAARVEFSQVVQDGRPVFRVRDNGVGFDMQYADKLFTPFQRLHAAEEFPGSGIGLAIVKRIVERHGGSVWVEAAPNRGATLSFTLEPKRL